MLERGLTVTDVAREIGKSRTCTSIAINHHRYAGTVEAVRRFLSL